MSCLQAGYAVIFLARKFSIQPFTPDLPSQDVLDLLQHVLSSTSQDSDRLPASSRAADSDGAAPSESSSTALSQTEAVLRDVRRVQEAGTLLKIPFTTLFEYLAYLKVIAELLEPFSRNTMFYLAAAVSDFYIPWSQMAEHKIQSDDGPLNLQLSRVPKMIGLLRKHWAPASFVASFKLETDDNMLLSKAAGAIFKYDVHAVVANILHTRKDVVLIVQKDGSKPKTPAVTTITREPSHKYIELQLVDQIVSLHQRYIAKAVG